MLLHQSNTVAEARLDCPRRYWRHVYAVGEAGRQVDRVLASTAAQLFRARLVTQDTNGLVFHAIAAALAVSAQNRCPPSCLHTARRRQPSRRSFEVNSMCVPRKPGEPVGSICLLEHKV